MALHFVETIRDPIHGAIGLTRLETNLLRTAAVSRMREINQLGLAYIIFPGANHNRLEHSVGAMHVVHLLCTGLRNVPLELKKLMESNSQALRLSALFHDIGHPPLSHVVEECLSRHPEYLPRGAGISTHEYFTKQIIENDVEIADLLRVNKLDKKLISDLAVGRGASPLRFLFSGSLDADRIDYILRDSYHLGLPYANIDLPSIVSGLRLEGRSGLSINEENVVAAEGLLSSRFYLTCSVYNNIRKRRVDTMLFRLLETALKRKKLNTTKKKRDFIINLHTKWVDRDLLALLENVKGGVSLEQIRRCQLPDIMYELGDVAISPGCRYNLFLISKAPEYVPLLQSGIAKLLRSTDVMIDLGYIRVPPIETRVRMTSGRETLLIDYSPTVRTLIGSVLKEIRLRAYGYQRVKQKPLKQAIENEIAGITARIRREKRPIIGTDLLLLVHHFIYQWCSLENLHGRWFVEGDTRFHVFLAEVTKGIKELGKIYPQIANLARQHKDLATISNPDRLGWKFFSFKLRRDLDVLTEVGLLALRRGPAAYPRNGERIYPWRYERRIFSWGRDYVKEKIIPHIPKSVVTGVQKKVYLTLTNLKDDFLGIEKLSQEADREISTSERRRIYLEVGQKKRNLIIVLGT